MTKKATRSQIELRITECYELLLHGYTFKDIVKHGMTKWGVGLTQSRSYVKSAQQIIINAVEEQREFVTGRAIAQRNFLYRKAVGDKSWGAAAQILNDRDKILGLFNPPPKQVDVIEAAVTLIKEGMLPDAFVDALQDGLQSMRSRVKQVTVVADATSDD